MSQQDIVYCDAAFFPEDNQLAILGIVYGKEVTRIKAKAKNGTVAELLSIIMARKLYPGKLIVNDCKAVTDMFNEGRTHSLQHMIGKDGQAAFLMGEINLNGIMWQRRRTDDLTCLVDSATRKTITKNFRWRLDKYEFILKEYGF